MPLFLCNRFDMFPTTDHLKGYVVRFFCSDDSFPGSSDAVKRVVALLWPWLLKKVAEFRAHLCKIVVLVSRITFVI
jgi:hypothetical protein